MSHDPADLPNEVESSLDLVRDNALKLLSAFTRPPSALRIRAGTVTLEAEWPVAPAPPDTAGTATVIAPAGSTSAPLDSTGEDSGAEQNPPHCVRAPAIGVFFRAPEPGAKPFVEVGDAVVAGQQVALVEVMKLMIPVHADVDGQVVEVLKGNGEAVEYDEPLFALTVLDS